MPPYSLSNKNAATSLVADSPDRIPYLNPSDTIIKIYYKY